MGRSVVSRSGVFDRRDTFLDLGGLLLLGAVALVLAALALAGVRFALVALPFAVGAVLGDGLVYVAILRNGWRGPALVVTSLAVLIVTSGLLLSLLGASAPWLFWEPEDLAWRLALGFTLGFGGAVLAQIPGFSRYAPASWEEAIEQRRDLIHVTLVVGGLLLALVTAISAIYGALALIAYAVGHLAG